jgi:hypothetical protein
MLILLLLITLVLSCTHDHQFLLSSDTDEHPNAIPPHLNQNHTVLYKWNIGSFKGMSVKFNSQDACTAFLAHIDSQRLLKRDLGFHFENDDTLNIQNIQRNPTWGLDRIDQPHLPLDGAYRYPASAGHNANIYIIDTYISHILILVVSRSSIKTLKVVLNGEQLFLLDHPILMIMDMELTSLVLQQEHTLESQRKQNSLPSKHLMNVEVGNSVMSFKAYNTLRIEYLAMLMDNEIISSIYPFKGVRIGCLIKPYLQCLNLVLM